VFFLKLVFRNAFRAKLRAGLTVLGLVIAIVAFGLLQTVVNAWYAGADAASPTRLVTRNAISLVFPLPYFYRERIRSIEGVRGVAVSNWFGGIYKDERNFFAQFAVQIENFMPMYPEFVFDPQEYQDLLRDRSGAAIGRQLAEQYGFKVGDRIPIRGTIYPGNWEFTVRAIYDGRNETTVTRQMYFHWDTVVERMKPRFPRLAERIGVFVVDVTSADRVAEVSAAIDREFANSLAETLTETEKAFQLSFVAMTEAILLAIQAVSFVVIVIIMAVMANTMAMTARERSAEHATLKALGFSGAFVALLIFAESVGIAMVGGLAGIAVTYPVAHWFADQMGRFFPIFFVSRETVLMQAAAALLVGVVAAMLPAWQAARLRVVDGLRAVA
jgi:putative ABC transport system permease protein